MPDVTSTRIGSTGVEIRTLGLGTHPLGGWPEKLDADTARETIHRAYGLGMRYFDTAPLYGHGRAEERLGEILAEMPRTGFAVSSKVGRLLIPVDVPEKGLFEFDDGAPLVDPVFDFSFEATLRSVRESLARLRLETLDIALLHDPDKYLDAAASEAWPALQELRARGVVGAIGAGGNHTEPLCDLMNRIDLDCVILANRYTLLEQDSLDDFLPLAVEKGVTVIVGGVYNSGLLASDTIDTAMYQYRPAPPQVIDRARALASVCEKHGVPLRAAALQFVYAHPAIVSVLVGARSPEEVEDNVAMLRTEIPGALWDELKERGLIREEAPTP